MERPSLTVKAVAADHRVSKQAANGGVTRLVELGILEETTGRSPYRVFEAPAVSSIVLRPSMQVVDDAPRHVQAGQQRPPLERPSTPNDRSTTLGGSLAFRQPSSR